MLGTELAEAQKKYQEQIDKLNRLLTGFVEITGCLGGDVGRVGVSFLSTQQNQNFSNREVCSLPPLAVIWLRRPKRFEIRNFPKVVSIQFGWFVLTISKPSLWGIW